MLEISTRQFRLEEDERDVLRFPEMMNFVKNLPGYIPGTLRGYNGDYRADFTVKVI